MLIGAQRGGELMLGGAREGGSMLIACRSIYLVAEGA